MGGELPENSISGLLSCGNAASMKTVFWLGFGNLIALF
jgi:hypothetical protein